MSKDTHRSIDFSVRHYGDGGEWGGWVMEHDKWILVGIYPSYVEGVRGCKKYIETV